MDQAKAPPELLEALRRIDPKADLVCVGQGFWVLGVREPNPYAVKVLEDELRDDPHGAHRRLEDREFHLTDRGLAQPSAASRLQLLQLYASGFKPIELYQVQRPGFDIVEDFRIRDHNWRTRPELAWQDTKARAAVETGDRARMDVLEQYIDQEAGSWFHNVMRGARRFWQRHAIPKGA